VTIAPFPHTTEHFSTKKANAVGKCRKKLRINVFRYLGSFTPVTQIRLKNLMRWCAGHTEIGGNCPETKGNQPRDWRQARILQKTDFQATFNKLQHATHACGLMTNFESYLGWQITFLWHETERRLSRFKWINLRFRRL